jgi:uncharacterized protein YjbI with pentapeptide repeats
MANEAQLKVLLQRTKTWNKWRAEDPEKFIDLSRANLKEANLRRASSTMEKADLNMLAKTA